ncbi:MAG: response regulator [Cytophagia bacterium]|nr:response regulator [Cytophagia bacterium]NBW34470.1 response regulator [Cytophagia bacterium]
MQSHILLVEDTEDLGENIKDILNIEGYVVRWERDGLAGFEACLQSTPDLIISDVVMPGLNGLELVKKIRDIVTYRHLPIIILSARATPEDQQKGLDAGATVYLRKPCKSTELIDAIQHLLLRTNTQL